MHHVFRALLNRLRPRAQLPSVTPGDLWVLDKRDASPWPVVSKYAPVRILEVRGGWVRYTFGEGLFNDERMTQWMFVSLYRPTTLTEKEKHALL